MQEDGVWDWWRVAASTIIDRVFLHVGFERVSASGWFEHQGWSSGFGESALIMDSESGSNSQRSVPGGPGQQAAPHGGQVCFCFTLFVQHGDVIARLPAFVEVVLHMGRPSRSACGRVPPPHRGGAFLCLEWRHLWSRLPFF